MNTYLSTLVTKLDIWCQDASLLLQDGNYTVLQKMRLGTI